MKIKRKFRVVVGSFATGALLSYLLDPVSGRRRREHAVEIIRRVTADIRHLVRSVDAAGDALTGADSEAPEPDGSTPAPAVAGVTDVAEHTPEGEQQPDGPSDGPGSAQPPNGSEVTSIGSSPGQVPPSGQVPSSE